MRNEDASSINFDIDKPFNVFICDGCREAGPYTQYGISHLDAAGRFAERWNKNLMSCSKSHYGYGKQWEEAPRKPEQYANHHYFQDERGNKLLII